MMQAQTIPAPESLANHTVIAIQGPADCASAINATGSSEDSAVLNPDRIDLFVWNIHKDKHADALSDLAELAGQMDLVLLQEASLENTHHKKLGQANYSSFAPGYRTADSQTGVVTISVVQPIVNCVMSVQEPWIKTPKAISITEFALTGTDQTLAVVNIHGVNFTLGTSDFGQQLETIRLAIEHHEGPVIVAGDFNTWNDGRIERVEQLCEQLGMTDLQFAVDHRVSPFSHPIDRVLIRGLKVINATTEVVDSSDHNPLTVRLSI